MCERCSSNVCVCVCKWLHCLCHLVPGLLLSKRESLIRKPVLLVFSDLQQKHNVVIDALGRHRGARLPAPLLYAQVLFSYLSLSSLSPLLTLFFHILLFIPLPLSLVSLALFFLNLLSSYSVLPSFCSPLFIVFSCSLIMFYLWAQATFKLNTKHRGKH